MERDTHYLTPQGLKKLQDEFHHLVHVRRKEIAERLEDAIAFGDLSENSEFIETKNEQAFIEGRILEIQSILASYTLIQEGNHTRRVVRVGSQVKIRKTGERVIEEFIIVGPAEAVPEEKKISHESPLGKALLDRLKGEEVEFKLPRGKVSYKIIDIE